MISIVGLVFFKELRETLRDRRTLMVMVLLPLALYPLVGIGLTQWIGVQQNTSEQRTSRVGWVGPVWPDLEQALGRGGPVELLRGNWDSADARERRVREEAIDVILVVPAGYAEQLRGGGTVEIGLTFDETRDRSTAARKRVRDALRALAEELRVQRLAERDLPPSLLNPLRSVDRGIASSRELGAHVLAGVLPLLVVLMVLLGAFYPAIDLTAGEKERGTLETLLAAPVPRLALIVGKFLVVATIALATGLLNLGSIGLTVALGFGPALRAAGLAASVPWSAVLLAALALLPAALFFAALMLAVAALARSFKEAQNLLTPVYMVCLLPALLTQVPGVELTPLTALLPVGNVALLARELIAGRASTLPLVLALFSTLVYTAIALRLAARIFDSERQLFTVEERRRWTGRRIRRATASAGEAAALLLLIMALILLLGRALQQRHLVLGILATEWLLLGLPVLLLLRFGGIEPRTALGLRSSGGLPLLGAALAGASGWYLVGVLVEGLQQRILPMPPEMIEEMRQALFGAERSLAIDLLAFALSPAICEELLFRGVLLQASRPGLRVPSALLLNALLFGLFHLSIYRFLPTALLGLVLSYLALRSRSIFPSIVFHFVNNASALIAGRLLADSAPKALTGSATSPLLAVLAGAVFLGGLLLVIRQKEPRLP